MKTSVDLPDDLLLTLDGRGDEKLQAAVDAAKQRRDLVAENSSLTPEQAKFISSVMTHAKTNGRLRFTHSRATYCPICKASPGYLKYKSGPRRGQSNYDKPLTVPGVDLSTSLVSFKNRFSLGCCSECWNILKPLLAEKLSDFPAEIPEQITGHPPAFKKYDNRKCSKCGWVGSERLMGKERTLMGDGYYPSSCPECGAKNLLFGKTIVGSADGFELFPTTKPDTP